ncbi:MAG: MarR family transcriptional regulator [Firmicutes bacterium]|nr:MarR family transcriptional regulator [Bacillota bacterium]
MLKSAMLAKLDEISRNVLIFISEKSNPDGMLIYPARNMGRELGYSEFEVRDAMELLESQGLIDVREGEDKEQPNVIIYREEWLGKLENISYTQEDHRLE